MDKKEEFQGQGASHPGPPLDADAARQAVLNSDPADRTAILEFKLMASQMFRERVANIVKKASASLRRHEYTNYNNVLKKFNP